MNLVWLLLLISVLYFGVFSNGVPSPTIVTIGAILNFDSINGRVSKIAMEAAVEDVNSDPSILGGIKLHLSMHNSNNTGILGVIEALQYMEVDIVAIIGPQSSVMARLLSQLANELQIPLLSFTDTDPNLSVFQYPFFVQTTPSDLFQMTAIADMISYYGWRKVTAIFTDDDNGQSVIAALGDKLAERHCKISYKAALPADPLATREEITDKLVKVGLMESRIIILHTHPNLGLLVFDVAYHLGMMGKGYVWIATAWLSTVLHSTSPLTPVTANSIQGALTLRPHTPGSERKTAFFSRWNKLSAGSIGLNPYGLYAYDSVWMIANAVKTFLDQGGTMSFSKISNPVGGSTSLHLEAIRIFDGGKQLLNNILQTNITGLTGPIRFHSDRSLIHPSYDVINVIGTSYRRIGYWSNYSGLSVVPPETLYLKPPNHSNSNQQLHSVIWPGETTKKPGGFFPNNGRRLRIGVPKRVTYRELVSQVNGTDEFKGYCIDVFLAAINLLPAFPYRFIPYGDGRKNPNYNELLNMVASNVFDAAIGDISIFSNRTKIVDFSHPYLQTGLVVLIPVRKSESTTWAFLQPFSLKMWIVITASFLLVGAVVWILEHRVNDEFRGTPKQQVATVLWFSFSTSFSTHRENTKSTLGRFVLIIWLFVIFIITSSYTASLTSILTVHQLSTIKGIESLIASDRNVGFLSGSSAANYLIDELKLPDSRLVAFETVKEFAIALERGIVDAVVDERPYVELYLSRQCKFSIVGDEFGHVEWGFAFPHGSPLAANMTTAILTLLENGELKQIYKNWLKIHACTSPSTSELELDRLHLSSFWGLFLIIWIASFFALLIYFVMTVRQFNQQRSDRGSTSSWSARLRTFFSFVNSKEEETKSKSKRDSSTTNEEQY